MASDDGYDYLGDELTVFAEATRWADYLAAQLRPYLRGTVFEVGAGRGTRTRKLSAMARQWVAIEPDRNMGAQLAADAASGALECHVKVWQGTLVTLPVTETADTVLYLDVLEHIQSDREELAMAASRLRAGGFLVVLSPAHPGLYSAFDRAIGHYRRYTLQGLEAIGPAKLSIAQCRMLDSVGLLASAGNRLLLRQSKPSRSQVLFWDRWMVPVSRWLDPVLGHRIGKSVLMVWQRAE